MDARFDAYTATLRGVQEDDVLTVVAGNPHVGDHTKLRGGFHGFQHRVSLIGDSGREFGSVSFGGQHRGLVMAEVKGGRTPEIVGRLRKQFPGHSCTRVDSCVDFDAPGTWDALAKACMAVKRDFRLKGEKRGDWEDFPEDGRTLYLGAASSAVRARLYEKGKHPDFKHLGREDWVRLEVQVRPEKDARGVYAEASALSAWGASAWTRELAARVLCEKLEPLPPYMVRELSGLDRAVLNLCRQYGQHLLGLLEERGDWACVGKALGDAMDTVQAERDRRRMH